MTEEPKPKRCRYGDPSCPCQDGDICHYEGENPMTPPDHARLLAVLKDIHAQIMGLPIHVERRDWPFTNYVARGPVLDIIEAEIIRLAPKGPQP